MIRGGTAGAIVRLATIKSPSEPHPMAEEAAKKGPLRRARLGEGDRSNLNSRRRRFLHDIYWGEQRFGLLIDALRPLAGIDSSLSDAGDRLAKWLGSLVLLGGLPVASAEAAWAGREALDWDVFADPTHALTGWVLETTPTDVKALATACALTDGFARRLLNDFRGGVGAGRNLDTDREALDVLGDLAEPVLVARGLRARAPLTLRVNTLKGDRDAAIAALAADDITARPTRWTTTGLIVEGARPNVQQCTAFKDGLVEVQDEGSALLVELLDPQPGDLIIDACAGAGGKTLAIAARMQGEGDLIALDNRPSALKELDRRAARAGVRVRSMPIRQVAELPKRVAAMKGKADRVLLDVPCSGSGALRRRPALGSPADDLVEAHVVMQSSLLRHHAPLVRPGGLLVYATCSVFHEENDLVVGDFLASDAGADFAVVPPGELLGAERAAQLGADLYLRLLPHRHGTDGFFGAALRRAGNAEVSSGVQTLKPSSDARG